MLGSVTQIYPGHRHLCKIRLQNGRFIMK